MTDMQVGSSYEAVPMTQPPDGSRAEIISQVMRKVCAVETVWGEGQEACEERCYEEKPVPEMCEACANRLRIVAATLVKPDAFVWEVWKDGETLAGIIRFANVRVGEDAISHYVFFDKDLRGKTAVMKSVIEWAFEDHPELNWHALRRLTVEIPDFAFALARHASQKLGFGGPFKWRMREGGPTLMVEGVKPEAVVWQGKRRDVLVMGLKNAKKPAPQG